MNFVLAQPRHNTIDADAAMKHVVMIVFISWMAIAEIVHSIKQLKVVGTW